MKAEELKNKELHLAVIGLGYVGLPLALAFSKKYNVIGYDLDKDRIKELQDGFDRTNELDEEDLASLDQLIITSDETLILKSNIYIVTVPTPVDKNNKPNLSYLISASNLIGKALKIGNVVIFESTVFPGCTEEICVPILEKMSNLCYNKDFFCGYSPERINPGDKKNSLKNVKKVVSGSNKKILELVADLYENIIDAGVYKSASIAVAEAAKAIENTQRDVNIALINELALIFDQLGLDTGEVLEAASTKWNFIPFQPGLVGGHCIGVDPYYLTHKAMELGYHPEMILAGRKINDSMGNFIAEKTISELVKIGINPIGSKVALLGLSFKENCPDLRNTKVISIIQKLREYKCDLIITDSFAQKDEAEKKFGVELSMLNKVKNQDAIILAVSHEPYYNFTKSEWGIMFGEKGVLIDVKSIYKKSTFSGLNIRHWRL